MTPRKSYALLIGSNANNGARTDYDNPLEGFELEE